MKEMSLQTNSRVEMIDITAAVRKAAGEERIESGICLIYTPHTTAAVTINENGRLVLGTWQSIFFCEFDGPRTRKFIIKFFTYL